MKTTSLWESVKFIGSQTWNFDKKIPLLAGAKVPCDVVNRLINVYLTALIIRAVTGGDMGALVWTVVVFSLCKLLTDLAARYLERQLSTRNYRLKMMVTNLFAARYMAAEFSLVESTEGKDLAQRAKNTLANKDYRVKAAAEAFAPQCASLVSNLLSLVVYTGIIAALNPLMILLLVVTTGVNQLLQKLLVRYDQKDKDRYVPLDRKLWYLIKEICDFSSAKDIRVYSLMGWLRSLFDTTLAQRMRLHVRRSHRQYALVVVMNVINFLFTAVTYAYLIGLYRQGGIDISQFVLYFGLITGFNAWLISLVDEYENIRRTLFDIDDLRRFCQAAQPAGGGEAVDGGLSGGIRFENVTFRYSEGTDVLRGMDFEIRPGEKIAIVGRNGAGKTTLVKLLCGLYQPDSGSILLDGRDGAKLDPEELRKRLSVVFQDVWLLPTTVERNITLSDRTDPERFREALALSGMDEVVAGLPQGEKTILVKSVLENAVELSGGQIQKLALARALYKGGDIFILDEPTAKLDPISENAMYQKYNALIGGKTAIFISHRLISTRFCDRIFYVEDGVVAEAGSHAQLMALDGKYAQMYRVQSRYYQEAQDEAITT